MQNQNLPRPLNRKQGRQQKQKGKNTKPQASIKVPRSFSQRLLLGLLTFWFVFPPETINAQQSHRPTAYTTALVTAEACQESISRFYKAKTGTRGRLIDFTSRYLQKVYLDNCANTHISNCKENFITYKELNESSETLEELQNRKASEQ